MNLKSRDWQINFSSIRHCYRFLFQSDFLNNFLTDLWCSILEIVNDVSDQGSNVSQGFWFLKIFDLNWQARMCCEALLRLCVSFTTSQWSICAKSVKADRQLIVQNSDDRFSFCNDHGYSLAKCKFMWKRMRWRNPEKDQNWEHRNTYYLSLKFHKFFPTTFFYRSILVNSEVFLDFVGCIFMSSNWR